MRTDKYYDPFEDLEKEVVEEIEFLATRIGGTITRKTRANSYGRSSKVIEIEYNIEVWKNQLDTL